MYKLNKTKLSLSKETVRVLGSRETRMARGAGDGNTVGVCTTANNVSCFNCTGANCHDPAPYSDDICGGGGTVATTPLTGCTAPKPV